MSKQTTSCLVTRFEVKAFEETERQFTGLAATWDLDLGGDVIERGAFKRTLKDWQRSKAPRLIPLLDSHNGASVRNVVGKMVGAEETEDGLESTFEVIEGPDGDEIFRRVKGGYVDGLSIGYSPVDVRYPETEAEKGAGIWRYLREVKLHEVSVVLWPMNPGARIDTASVKALLLAADKDNLSDDERAELTALEKQLGALLKREPAPDALEALLGRIERVQLRRLAARVDAVRLSGVVPIP